MAKKIFQALKFTEGLTNDLKTLAEMKRTNYNAYVEAVLSAHVIVEKRALREKIGEQRRHQIIEAPCIQTIEQKVNYS